MSDAHVDFHTDALELESKGEVHLFEILLSDNTYFRFRNGPKCTWQGNTYENVAIAIGGENYSSDDTNNRPALNIFNPKKIFGPYVQQGKFDLARVTRRVLLRNHLDSNLNISVASLWIIRRIVNVTSTMLHCELSSPLDGPGMTVPQRHYGPPEFPYVAI
jgi:phage-related protein